MTQVDLARRIGISASYLNLIEHNRRTLPAELLIRLTEVLPVDLKTLSPDHDGRVLGELLEAFGDPLFDELDVLAGDVREFAMNFPTAGQAVLRLYEAYRAERESAQSLGEKLLSDGEGVAPVAGTRLPTEEVSDFLQRHLNYFPELEEGAETLTRDSRATSSSRTSLRTSSGSWGSTCESSKPTACNRRCVATIPTSASCTSRSCSDAAVATSSLLIRSECSRRPTSCNESRATHRSRQTNPGRSAESLSPTTSRPAY